MDKEARKISDIFSDTRLTNKEIDYLALRTVLATRTDAGLDNIEFFCDRYHHYRYSIGVGVDLDTNRPLVEYLEA